MKVKHSFRKTCILHTGNSCTHTPKFLSTNTFEFPTLSNEQLPEISRYHRERERSREDCHLGAQGFAFTLFLQLAFHVQFQRQDIRCWGPTFQDFALAWRGPRCGCGEGFWEGCGSPKSRQQVRKLQVRLNPRVSHEACIDFWVYFVTDVSPWRRRHLWLHHRVCCSSISSVGPWRERARGKWKACHVLRQLSA